MLPELRGLQASLGLHDRSPGFALLLTRGFEVVAAESSGVRNSDGEPIGLGSAFRIASVAKQFTAAAVLVLVVDGALDLATPVSGVMPELGRIAGGVTVQHLLTHTSGLPHYERLVPAYRESVSDADVVDLLVEFGAVGPTPGKRYEYSNSGYCVLAQLVTRVSGRSFADVVRTRVLLPAGMPTATVGPEAAVERVYGHELVDGTWILRDQSPTTSTQGDGGIYASAVELDTWQRALHVGERVLPRSLVTAMTAPYVATQYAGESYGFGIAMTELAGHRVLLHRGMSTGFENALFYVPDLDLSLALLSNVGGETWNATRTGKAILHGVLP